MPLSAIVQVLKNCLVVLSALFPIVNPLGTAPIFLSLTQGYSSRARALLARKVALNSFWLLTGSILTGTHILDFFGVSIPVVQVGGGLVVVSAGWKLLNSEPEQARTTVERKISKEDIAARAFYPLTLPLTVGPGSISVAITLGANSVQHMSQVVGLTAAVIGAFLVAITIFLSYRFAEPVGRALGQTAMNVIVRLTSFILLCIGVQILWNGIHTLMH